MDIRHIVQIYIEDKTANEPNRVYDYILDMLVGDIQSDPEFLDWLANYEAKLQAQVTPKALADLQQAKQDEVNAQLGVINKVKAVPIKKL